MSVDYRAEFDIPRDVCYLNSCYMTPQPRRVVEAACRGAARRSQPWSLAPADFFTEVEVLRAAFARQIGCANDNIAIVPSAGYGVACAAKNLRIQSGDLVLALGDQFPSNYYAWRRETSASGAAFHVVDREPEQTWSEAILSAIELHGDAIAVATLEGHHWASAEIIELETVIPALRDVGARVVLDLTQSIGAYPIDIKKLGPDFMVSSGYKWLFCPYGVSFLYVDDEHFDGIPIEEAWIDRAGAEDFSRLSEFTDSYQPGARRYDVSEKSSFSNIAGAVAALEMIEEWGVPNISELLANTNERIAEILLSHGFETTLAAARAPHFQGAVIPSIDPRELASRLTDEGVYASVRGKHLRVAPHLYTDDVDLLRFDAALGMSVK